MIFAVLISSCSICLFSWCIVHSYSLYAIRLGGSELGALAALCLPPQTSQRPKGTPEPQYPGDPYPARSPPRVQTREIPPCAQGCTM